MAGLKLRSIEQDKPFCWISRRALDLIRGQCDQENTVATAMAVYLALSERASRVESQEFSMPHGLISSMSGCSRRTVQYRLEDLVECGLLEIQTPSLKMASTFRLLSPDVHPLRIDAHPTSKASVALFPNKVPRNQEEKGKNTSPFVLRPSERITLEKGIKRAELRLKELRADEHKTEAEKEQQRQLAGYCTDAKRRLGWPL